MKLLGKGENLNAILARDSVVLVKFGAEWCGPCKMIDPVLAKLSQTTEDANFVSVDVDEHKNLAETFGIKSVPALLVFKNGEEVNRAIGFQTNQQIKELLNKAS